MYTMASLRLRARAVLWTVLFGAVLVVVDSVVLVILAPTIAIRPGRLSIDGTSQRPWYVDRGLLVSVWNVGPPGEPSSGSYNPSGGDPLLPEPVPHRELPNRIERTLSRIGAHGLILVESGLPLRCMRGYLVPGSRERCGVRRREFPWLIPYCCDPFGLAVNVLSHATIVGAALWTARHLRAASRRRAGLCGQCGYPRTGSGPCPECGAARNGDGTT